MHGRDPSWWQGHLQRIEKEGIGTKDYALREGLDVKTLYESRRNFKRRISGSVAADEKPDQSRPFVQLKLAAPEAPDHRPAHCCLILPSGVRLEISDLPSIGWTRPWRTNWVVRVEGNADASRLRHRISLSASRSD